MGDAYEEKFRELKTYIPFLEERIEHYKKIKLKFNYPDPERENKLKNLQITHKILVNKEGKRLKMDTLLSFEKKLKLLVEQDYSERHSKTDSVNRRDYNPLHNAEAYRPGSSCSSSTTASSASTSRPKKVLDDCPASPSPPTSPLRTHAAYGAGPIIIPTDRRSPPRSRYRTPTPPLSVIPNIIPITRVNVKEQGPKEWDSDGESDPTPQTRPTIIIPGGILKKNLPKKEEPNRWDYDEDVKRHPSANIPTVHVNALEGSRRLSTVLEKSKVFSDFDRLLSPHCPRSPMTNMPDMGLRSPDPEIFGRQIPPQGGMPRIDHPGVPSLLMKPPTMSARPPLALDDIAEYLDDKDCNNLKPHMEMQPKLAGTMPRPVSRVGLPDMLSPRPEKTLSPNADPRLSSDPRSRGNVDPRTIPNDPRMHGAMPPLNDPRSLGGRFMPDKRPDMMTPGEFQRSRYSDQYGQDSSVMGMSPMHGIPGPGPPAGYPPVGQMGGPHNPQINYDYRMGPNQPVPQQWTGPPHGPGMMQNNPQPVPPPSNMFPMGPQGPGMRPNVPDQSGWPMHMMNGGDNRIPPGYPNQMQNMPRPNAPHAPSSMSMGGGYPNPQNKYSSYPFEQQQQQPPMNDYRRPSGWNGAPHGAAAGEPRNFNRPGFMDRPTGPPNNWNQNHQKDGPRPQNRDPRMQRNEAPPPVPAPLPPQGPNTSPLRVSQVGKEVHPNKLNKQNDNEIKKRLEKMRLDVQKNKEKSKDRFKEKSKDSEKAKDKKQGDKKNSDKSSKSQVTNLYGTIDAKKAVQGSGLTKFKIPKKRPSIDVHSEQAEQSEQPEAPDTPETNAEEENWSDNEATPEPSKKSGEKDQVKKKKQKEIHTQALRAEAEKFKLLAQQSNTPDIQKLVKDFLKNLEKAEKKKDKKAKKTVIYSSDEDEESSDNDKPYTTMTKKKQKQKKPSSLAIEDSSDDSTSVEATSTVEKQKSKTISKELKVNIGKLNVSELKKKGKLKNSFPERESASEETTALEKGNEFESTDVTTENTNISDAATVESEIPAQPAPPSKPKGKRRNRELEVLQEDLKASWMCDDLMNTTNVRSCSQKNKIQEQAADNHDEDPKPGKARRAPGPKSKTKAKKSAPEVATEHSETENDGLLAAGGKESTSNAKTKKPANRKGKGKAATKVCPPPLFDDSSNDEFNLDASAVEPSSDISLHPEGNKTKKKTGEKTVADEAESSSDESYVSNSSSLLLDSAGKPRDSNEELLEDVMHQLSNNPKYSRAKKKQVKKKRSSWQNGVLSKAKRKKKKTDQNKINESSSTSATTEDASNKENDSSMSDKKLSLRLSTESLDEDGVRNRFNSSQGNDEDITSRVDPDALIQYTLSDGNEQKQCLLCPFYRKNIVQHYKTTHPRKEVLISRLPIENSKLAIDEAKLLDLENNITPPNLDEQDNFNCRFCSFSTHGISNFARESFYEHLTTHTGEYRFKCLTCGYQCYTKNSIRSHFYKECKKHSGSKNVNEVVQEDVIPNESRICGYMCSKCHFLQLKRDNVETHVNMWHSKNLSQVKIVKIDMSLKIKNEMLVKKEDSVLEDPAKDENDDTKENIFAEALEDDVKMKISSIAQKESEISVLLEATEPKPEKKDNLSAFVCATGDYGDKDLEIQNERKKKMEEIAANIGIRPQKRLSIIDQLKDKISLPEEDETCENVIQNNDSTDPLNISGVESKLVEAEPSEALAQDIVKVKVDPDTTDVEHTQDKSASKLMDPLAFVGSTKPDTEHSNSPLAPPVQYESDSSGGSDHDDHTDVSSILQQSTDGDVPGQSVRMLTTIQRLAAQIHNNKQSTIDTSSLPEPHPETIVADVPPVKIKTEKVDDDDDALETKVKSEVKKEPLSPSQINNDEDAKDNVKTETHQSPKKFIRIRRISGDKLSKGGDQEPQDEKTPILDASAEDTGFCRIENVMSLAPTEGESKLVPILPKKTESTSPKTMKGLSILKSNQYIIQRPDGTCSVMTTQGPGSVMTSAGEAVKIFPLTLPSTSRAVVPKSENVISIAGQPAVSIKIDGNKIPLSMVTTHSGPISSNLTKSPTSPVKYIKFISNPEIATAVKLKSAEVYEKMLQDDKLLHPYKCMGRDCCFSTSLETAFQKHLKLHEDDLMVKVDGPKDYLKCAYCYNDCASIKDLMTHLKSNHTFCSYCCKYCFYRAFARSYVELHQKTKHPLKKIQILSVDSESTALHAPQPSKRLDRKAVIKPYVCEHECNKYFFIPEAFTLHLNMHHPSLKNTDAYKCHVCKEFVPSVDELIAHYKKHGYFKYHCLYCTFGAAKMSEMHSHLSAVHFNLPPEILERCLPREISKNMSAIDQLKIHDVDNIYMQRKPSNDESPKVAIPPLAKIGSESFLPLSSLDSSLSNIRIVDSRSLNTTAAANVFNVGNNVQITVPAHALLAANAMNDADKNSTSILSQENSVNKCSTYDSDSDIEIIEEKSAPQRIESAENQIKQESVDDSLDPNDSCSSSQTQGESNTSSGRFLTLDDVKDTGLSGRELLRCGAVNCQFSADSKEELNIHMKQCTPTGEEDCADTISALVCPHCSKKFGKVNFYMDHLKTHGVKRFKCGLCDSRFAVQSQAQTHLRTKHKHVSSKAVPADVNNPAPDGLFIIQPMSAAERSKNKKLARSPEKAASLDPSKATYSPTEISSLPLRSIFIQDIQCQACPFKTKVRSNMIRHLQAHLKDEKVPDSTPVNPVPCLDKKERMFDKMINLASSSHENGRMGGGMKENKEKDKVEEDDGLPKFIPEHKRYVCGVPDCNYLTVDEGTLRHHIKALHSDEAFYKCPHCASSSSTLQDQASSSQSNIPLDKMANHFKMHDCRLFKCSYCVYYHYQRHVVDRHLQDKHSDKPSIVKVIRDQQSSLTPDHQSTSSSSSTVTQPPEELELPDPDGNTWKCCLCDFKSVLKQAMQNHAQNSHGEKNQFQCHCGYKALSKTNFEQHLKQRHPNDPNVDYITIYKRIKSLKKPEAAADTLTPQGEPFDTTPLWRRDRFGGVRHIRGILVEEEPETVKSPTKRKLDPAHKSKDSKPDVKKLKLFAEDSLTEEGFGPYGTPTSDMFACPSCQFKSKNKCDFKEHLHRELKYYKWSCPSCEYMGVNRRVVIKHSNKAHPTENCEPVEAPTNEKIEKWVLEALIHQSEIMKGIKKVEESDDEDFSLELKDEDFNGELDEDTKGASYETLSEPIKCKHCTESFAKWRGFKRHVQLMHLKRLGFCCPYCDQSTNSELRMMQHVRTKHAGMPEKVIENKNTNTDDLTDEFWEKEYGLVVPKRPKKRKRKEDAETLSKVEIEHPCDECDYVAGTSAELKNHLKSHELKIRRQCLNCSYQTYSTHEIRHHWELNHPQRDYLIEEAYVSPVAFEMANRQDKKKLKTEDEKKSTVYYCYYCDMGSIDLDVIRKHWKSVHNKGGLKTIFKYKEHSEKVVRCAYCAEAGTMAMLASHIKQKHGIGKEILMVEKEEDGWLCKWASDQRCQEEFIYTKEDMDNHHQSFHANLPLNFKLTRRSFVCNECKIKLSTIDAIQKHAKIHLNAYKCKHCDQNFKSFAMVKQHFALAHPEFEAETRTITSDDLSKEIDDIIEKSTVFSDLELSPVTVTAPFFKSPPTSPRIAKKSTTKQLITSPRRQIPVKPSPKKIRAVARKSTNPLPRYPMGIVFETEEYISYYNKPIQSVDLEKIHIEMAVGGLKRKINCSHLGTFGINIYAKPKLLDCMKNCN